MKAEKSAPTWGVVGQERAVAVLRRAVEDEARLSHAYLLAGPERVGRATAARRFAQALNCGAEGERPCDDCRSCRLIAEDKHPDVEWVGVGGVCDEHDHDDSREIRICQIRRLERVVSRAPFEARCRVVIVEPAEAMTTEAANAFLKTLEEPPDYVVLVLIASREETLPETVRSRCRRVAFSGVPREEIEGALKERWGAEPERAATLARMAQGRLGWAVAALEDERMLVERERALDEVEAVLSGGLAERFGYAESRGRQFLRGGADEVRAALDCWRDWWRDVFLTAAGQESLVAAPERLDTLRSKAAQYEVEGALRALNVVREARAHLEENANPMLALEAMLVELPSA